MAHFVRGLLAPTLLVDLLATGRWKHPGDGIIRQVVPSIDDPLEFLLSLEHMERESGSLNADATEWMHAFHGCKTGELRDLPWLDADCAFFVAINAQAGDDVAIALDYRTSVTDPRVVASDWTDDGCFWRQCAETFSEFVRELHL